MPVKISIITTKDNFIFDTIKRQILFCLLLFICQIE